MISLRTDVSDQHAEPDGSVCCLNRSVVVKCCANWDSMLSMCESSKLLFLFFYFFITRIVNVVGPIDEMPAGWTYDDRCCRRRMLHALSSPIRSIIVDQPH